jgi:Putative mono-oxygenase ydhR
LFLLALALCLWLALPGLAHGQTRPKLLPEASAEAAPTVVVVEVARPWYAMDWMIVRRMRDAVPQYRAAPGLRFKAFTLARASGDFGGIYLWRDRAAANAWFNAAWYRRVREQFGVEPRVRMFAVDGPVRIAGNLYWATQADAMAALVVVPEGHRASAPPEDALIAYPIRTATGRGQVLIWRDGATANRAVAAWRKRSGGAGVQVEWFDAPILTPAAAVPSALVPPATETQAQAY